MSLRRYYSDSTGTRRILQCLPHFFPIDGWISLEWSSHSALLFVHPRGEKLFPVYGLFMCGPLAGSFPIPLVPWQQTSDNTVQTDVRPARASFLRQEQAPRPPSINHLAVVILCRNRDVVLRPLPPPWPIRA